MKATTARFKFLRHTSRVSQGEVLIGFPFFIRLEEEENGSRT